MAAATARRSTPAMDKTRRVAQACDACKLRKVKCNGQERCQQCSHLDLKCIYSAVRAQRRTSQKRGRLISEYKKSTAAATSSSLASLKPALDAGRLRQISPPSAALAAASVTSPTARNARNGQSNGSINVNIDGILKRSDSDINLKSSFDGNITSPSSPNFVNTPLFSREFFLELLPDYVSVVYPLNPVISESELRESIAKMNYDLEHAALAYSAAAVTINLTRPGSGRGATDISSDISSQIKQLITRAIELTGGLYLDTRLTIRRIMVSMFLHNCLMTLQKLDLAFFYLRQAQSMMQMLRIGSAEMLAQSQYDISERARRERLYWLAFVHERFLSIVDYRPAILTPLADLPEKDPGLPEGVHQGFNEIIKLFRLVDGEFLHNWLGSHSDSGLTTSWIEQKQKELDDEDEYLLLGSSGQTVSDIGVGHEASSLDSETKIVRSGSNVSRTTHSSGLSRLTDMQQADLIITRQWLRTVVWQMAMSRCLLSSGASKECMSLLFPVRLSHHLRFLITNMSRNAIETHGSGILKKLFELADTIADVIIHVPIASRDETTARVDDFLFLIRFLFTFPRFDAFEREILREKLKALQALFPHVHEQEMVQEQGQNHTQVQTRHIGQDQNQDSGQNLAQSQSRNQIEKRGDEQNSALHQHHSPVSMDGTASTITIVGTDTIMSTSTSSAITSLPATSPVPASAPLYSMTTTANISQQVRQHGQQQSPPVTNASLAARPNTEDPHQSPNLWIGMHHTILHHHPDPSLATAVMPSPSSTSAASLSLSSPTLSNNAIVPTTGHGLKETMQGPRQGPYSVVEMATHHQHQQQQQQQQQQSPKIRGLSGGQGYSKARRQSMTRRLSMALMK